MFIGSGRRSMSEGPLAEELIVDMVSPRPGDDAPRPAGRRGAWVLLIGVLALHGFQSVQMFPTLQALADPEAPVVVIDHAIHLYHGYLGSRFLSEHGRTWGYDPFFM